MIGLALIGAATFAVELTHYRATEATDAQNAAYEQRDVQARAASLKSNVHGRLRLTLRPNEARALDEHFIKGTVTLVERGGQRALRIDAMPFYSGSPYLIQLCREQQLMASRSGRRLNMKTFKVTDGSC